MSIAFFNFFNNNPDSSDSESPIKMNNIKKNKRQDDVKRKKANVIESDSDEEVIVSNKKKAKTTNEKVEVKPKLGIKDFFKPINSVKSTNNVKSPVKEEENSKSKRKLPSEKESPKKKSNKNESSPLKESKVNKKSKKEESPDLKKNSKLSLEKTTPKKNEEKTTKKNLEKTSPRKIEKVSPKKTKTTPKKDEKVLSKKTTTKASPKKTEKEKSLVDKKAPKVFGDESLGVKMVKSPMKLNNLGVEFNKNKPSSTTEKAIDQMWVNKYKPKTTANIVGQTGDRSCANKLKFWLNNWHKNKDVKPAFSKFGPKANDNGAGFKAALLSGCPGIGKTTTAHLVAKECNYELVEFNASDTRNKKSMDEQISTLLGNKTLNNYFHDPKQKAKMTSRHVLVMDEVDGMGGNADRGGINELIQFIKKTKIPIICICNDRNDAKIRSLSNYCFDLRFSKPRVDQIKAMLLSICQKENFKVNPEVFTEIIEMSNHDIRQVLHYFSVFADKKIKLNSVNSNKIIKDVKLGPFDAVKKVFTAGPEYQSMTFREKSDLFFNDYSLMPLFAFENYIRCKPYSSKGNETLTINSIAKSIDAICFGDIIESQIKSSQNYSLLPLEAVFSTVMPGYYMNGHFSGMINFPSILGKISSINKKERLSSELKLHMNLKVTGSKTCLTLDYLLPLRNKILDPLLNKEKDGIEKTINTLNNYYLLKDDLESIIELTTWGNEKNPFAAVDTKTKSALTRAYNKTTELLPYAGKDMIKKVKTKGKPVDSKSKKSQKNEFDDDEEEEEFDENDEDLPDF